MLKAEFNAGPDFKATRIPVAPTIDPAYFEEEKDKIFRKTWLIAGQLTDLKKVGDYVVKDFEMVGLSVIIVRGRDMTLRAFHNVCRHRGNKLVYNQKGCSRAFTCGFHGWTYSDQGQLVNVPFENNFGELDKDTLGLVSVALDTWQGMVFVNFDKSPETLRSYLGAVCEILDGYPLAEMEITGQYSSRVVANWKTFQDAFMESYHVTVVHQRSLPDLRKGMTPRDIMLLDRHSNQTAYIDLHHEPFPTEKVIWQVGNGFMRSADSGGLPQLPRGMNRKGAPNWAFDQFCIFPNLLLMIGNGWFTMHQFWPITVDETLWEAKYFAAPNDNPMGRVAQEFFKVRLRDTIREDMSTVEATHAALRSGVISEMVLCEQEGLIAHNRRVMDQYMGAE